MGLIDYVVCHMPLPEPAPPPGTEFQTNDFPDPGASRYTIHADGRLLLRARDYRDGEIRDVEYPFHGDIEIYRTMGDHAWDFWLRFTDGRCVKVWRPPAHDPNKPALHSEVERLEALKDAPPRQ